VVGFFVWLGGGVGGGGGGWGGGGGGGGGRGGEGGGGGGIWVGGRGTGISVKKCHSPTIEGGHLSMGREHVGSISKEGKKVES